MFRRLNHSVRNSRKISQNLRKSSLWQSKMQFEKRLRLAENSLNRKKSQELISDMLACTASQKVHRKQWKQKLDSEILKFLKMPHL